MEDIQKKNITGDRLRKRIIISLIFMSSIFLINKFEWVWFKDWGIDPVTLVFFTFLPVILLLKISWRTNALVSLMLIFFMSFFSLNKYSNTTESFAILVFLLIATSVCQRIIEIYRET